MSAAGERGTVLKRANLGINVPGGVTVAGAPSVPAGLFPSNWISANPQFNQANYYTNSGSSNYHSLQLQSTLRPRAGLSVQGTYIWSRSLEVPLNGSNIANGLQTAPVYTNPAERNKDYASVRTTSRMTSGLTARSNCRSTRPAVCTNLRVEAFIEGRQTSFIVNLSTGQPATVSSIFEWRDRPTGLYAGSVPTSLETSRRRLRSREGTANTATSGDRLPALWILSATQSLTA